MEGDLKNQHPQQALHEPNYGKIVSSAALLAQKPVVSAEAFTCLYGFPDKYHRQ